MRRILGVMRKAIEQFNMIEAGDRIAVGVSGGKDSLLLLTALNQLKHFYTIPFELIAIHINMGFSNANIIEYNAFTDYIKNLGVELIIEDTKLGEILFDIRKEKNPCSLCSNIRRGALNTIAIKHNCNKIALGHHQDDVIETFLLSLMYESRLSTFKPVSYLDRTKITLIRPFVLLSERDIIGYSKNLPVFHNPCPANKNTKREYMKDLIKKLINDIPMSKQRIFAAITHPERNSLWDEVNTIEEDIDDKIE